MGNQLVVSVSNPGDWSVGIPGLSMTITFQGNMDFLHAVQPHREDFKKDIEDLVQTYFDDMPSEVGLQDECPSCGSILELTKKGYKHTKEAKKACDEYCRY